ncbi:MAG: calcium-binding protein, partial [Betaproteobacteria bacterium]|nr:calcium-binding protein [Betaproteobacteria bacterium]
DTVRYEYNRNGFNGSIQFTGTVSTGIQIDPQGGTDVISNVEELQVNAGSGNDLIIGDPVLRNWFEGGQGNDTLSGGQINDWLRGGSGADSIVGLGGNDWIVVSGSSDDGNDTIDGGEGFDTVEYNWWAWDRAIVFTSVFVPGTTNYAQIDPAGGIDTILNVEQVAIWGGRGNDILTGDPGNNELRGRQGADTLTGGGGNDTFVVQLSESDNGVSVNLNQPADLITDFGVGDVIQVRDWTPTALLTGVSTSSLLAGQALVLSGNNGEVVLHVGADSVAGSDLSIRLQGGLDPERIQVLNQGSRGSFVYLDATSGNDSIVGTNLSESLFGIAGDDTILGLDGNDFIEGGAGNDSLHGGLGGDRFNLGRDDGSDTIDGGGYNTRTPWPSILTVPQNGNDYDRLDYRYANGGLTLNLSSRTVSVAGLSGVDTYINVEEVQGSPYKDIVSGRPSQGFESNPSTGWSFFFWGLGGSDEITQTPYSDNGKWPVGAGGRWTDGLQVGYSWSDTPITVNWVGNEAKVSYGAGTGAKASTNVAYAAGVDTLRNIMNIQTTDFDDVINGQGATLNHLGYLSNPYERISYFLVDARGGNDVIRGNGNFLLSPSVNTATSALPADGRGVLVDGRSLDTSGLITMDLSHLKAAFSATGSHGVVKFSGVSYVFGTPFNDTVYAGNGIDDFRGQGGDDSFYGDDYNNQASYRSATNAIEVNLAAGTAKDRVAGSSGNPQGGTSNGSDTLRGVEAIEGTRYDDARYDDVYDARGFSQTSQNAGGIAAGWMGMRNLFLPMGGNDTVTGNGYTGLSYYNAMMGIKADLAAGYVDALTSDATLRASPDYLYTVGRTSFTGVAGIEGTDYADSIAGGTKTMFYGTAAIEVYSPRGGADTVDGRDGYDIVWYSSSPNPIRVDMRLSSGQVIDDGWGASDTLISVERVEGSHFNDSFIGNDANNDFQGNRGADSIDGGGGYDEVAYITPRLVDPTGKGGVIVDLGGASVDAATRNASVYAANQSLSVNAAKPAAVLPSGFTGWARDNWGEIDYLKDIEGVEGSDWDDVLIGSD